MNGKMLMLNPERYIYILENEQEEYITENENTLSMRYRNYGIMYNHNVIEEAFVMIKNNMIEVLDDVGNTKFYFPLDWLNTDQMKMQNLIDKGLIVKFK